MKIFYMCHFSREGMVHTNCKFLNSVLTYIAVNREEVTEFSDMFPYLKVMIIL